MGYSFTCTCDSCGYTLKASLGAGINQSDVEKEEADKMREGFYGEQGIQFFGEHPDGRVTCEHVVIRCTQCKSLENCYDLGMEIPDPDIKKRLSKLKRKISLGEINWISQEKLDMMFEDHFYIPYESYHHRCIRCGSKAEIIEDFYSKLCNREVECPECGNKLRASGHYLLWD